MNEKNDLMQIITNMTARDSQPTLNREETTKTYITSEIYDNPAEYSTVRGIFRYVGIDIIGE